jgi:hypothetical protein
MKTLLKKEATLTAPPITYLFLAFALMALIPGYPILLGAFFICFGLFQSYQSAREAGDILYSAMLPVRKRDVVRAKFAFAACIELAGWLLAALLTALRMTVLAAAPVYLGNAMMNANPAFLGWFLLLCAAFNLCFLGGFFRTAYKIGVPFLTFGVVTLFLVFIAEALHHFPGLEGLNATTFRTVQLVPLLAGAVLYPVVTLAAARRAVRRFDRLDL